jgi:hypothetical protein
MKDAFEFKPVKRFHFLQRWTFQLLRWYGSLQHQRVKQTDYVRFTLDTGAFMQRLIDQQEELFRHWNEAPGVLLIGAKDFQELMHTPEIRHHLEFVAPMTFQNGDPWERPRLMGLEVEVVPWMEGMILMPEGWRKIPTRGSI